MLCPIDMMPMTVFAEQRARSGIRLAGMFATASRRAISSKSSEDGAILLSETSCCVLAVALLCVEYPAPFCNSWLPNLYWRSWDSKLQLWLHICLVHSSWDSWYIE